MRHYGEKIVASQNLCISFQQSQQSRNRVMPCSSDGPETRALLAVRIAHKPSGRSVMLNPKNTYHQHKKLIQSETQKKRNTHDSLDCSHCRGIFGWNIYSGHGHTPCNDVWIARGAEILTAAAITLIGYIVFLKSANEAR